MSSFERLQAVIDGNGQIDWLLDRESFNNVGNSAGGNAVVSIWLGCAGFFTRVWQCPNSIALRT